MAFRFNPCQPCCSRCCSYGPMNLLGEVTLQFSGIAAINCGGCGSLNGTYRLTREDQEATSSPWCMFSQQFMPPLYLCQNPVEIISPVNAFSVTFQMGSLPSLPEGAFVIQAEITLSILSRPFLNYRPWLGESLELLDWCKKKPEELVGQTLFGAPNGSILMGCEWGGATCQILDAK